MVYDTRAYSWVDAGRRNSRKGTSMTKSIIEMAREAGAVFPADGSYHQFERHEDLEAFAKLVREDEREECAKLCDEVGKESASHWPHRFSNMIRARSNT
jgi:hypothetical protein